MLWDTEYAMGGGGEAESSFRFLSERARWEWESAGAVHMDFMWGAGYGTAWTGSDAAIDPESLPYPEIALDIAGRTRAGGEHTETVRISDYYAFYPVNLELAPGRSVEYTGDYGEALEYLTELFRIPAGEDRTEITVEKNREGDIIRVGSQAVPGEEDIVLASAWAWGENELYFLYGCENARTGERADRGQNDGIFRLPFEVSQEDSGWIRVDLTQMEKVGELPEDAVPAGLLRDMEGKRLYLAGRRGTDYDLYIYALTNKTPKLEETIPLGQFPESEFRQISQEDGGLFLTWSDNSFAFVEQEDGRCLLWCEGRFPDGLEEKEDAEDKEAEYRRLLEKPFPREQECLFDGERLVLAAFEEKDGLNVLAAVYDREGEIYSGRYIHSGAADAYPGNDYGGRIMPQGKDYPVFPGEYQIWAGGKPLLLTQ